MFGITKEQFQSFVRHVVTFVGGILVANGQVDPTQIETIVGLIVTVAGLVFSFLAPEKKMTAETVVAKLGPEKAEAIEKIIAAPAPPKPKAVVTITEEQGAQVKPATFPPVVGG